jgi:hypothetical protein
VAVPNEEQFQSYLNDLRRRGIDHKELDLRAEYELAKWHEEKKLRAMQQAQNTYGQQSAQSQMSGMAQLGLVEKGVVNVGQGTVQSIQAQLLKLITPIV